MPRLKDRNRQIPNGLVFYQPQTGWKPRRFSSFTGIVQALIAHRKANPFLVKKHNLSTDFATVANEVDEFNANVCLKMGWAEYVALAGGGQQTPAPFPEAPTLLQKLGRVAAGGGVIVDWITSAEEAVPGILSESRAAVCAKCPLNETGDWTRFFTVPLSRAIQTALNVRKTWNLKTTFDDRIKVCAACDCPLPLKVHVPIQKIMQRIPDESKAKLHPDCWMRSEGGIE